MVLSVCTTSTFTSSDENMSLHISFPVSASLSSQVLSSETLATNSGDLHQYLTYTAASAQCQVRLAQQLAVPSRTLSTTCNLLSHFLRLQVLQLSRPACNKARSNESLPFPALPTPLLLPPLDYLSFYIPLALHSLHSWWSHSKIILAAFFQRLSFAFCCSIRLNSCTSGRLFSSSSSSFYKFINATLFEFKASISDSFSSFSLFSSSSSPLIFLAAAPSLTPTSVFQAEPRSSVSSVWNRGMMQASKCELFSVTTSQAPLCAFLTTEFISWTLRNAICYPCSLCCIRAIHFICFRFHILLPLSMKWSLLTYFLNRRYKLYTVQHWIMVLQNSFVLLPLPLAQTSTGSTILPFVKSRSKRNPDKFWSFRY